MSESLKLALEFAKEKHKGQKRIGGDDYITHPMAVCEIVKNQGFDENCQIAALFHDLLEDTDATEDEILKYGSPAVLEAVKLLTKEKGYDMAQYIGAIKQNPIACAVKAADRLHNLQCAIVTNEEFKRKYILETVDWYMDFSSDIRKAVKRLAESLESPMTELSFLYEPIETWKE
ncbi:MAG: HD domain-containing protein [Clostridia bacterium]|nr:HD domain-containing protein [Clostridia bacterium]